MMNANSVNSTRSIQQTKLLERTRQLASLEAVKSSTPITSGQSAVHSSALQSDLAKRFNLPGAASAIGSNRNRAAKSGGSGSVRNNHASNHTTNRRVSNSAPGIVGSSSSSSSHTQQYATVSSADTILCLSCEFDNEPGSTTCACCGYFLSSAHRQQEQPTFAQRLGITEGPKHVPTTIISLSKWEAIEEKAGERNEAYCPICMVGYNQGSEVLLSCSHVFHRACIFSFEKFNNNKNNNNAANKANSEGNCCPICRCTNYQKRITHKGSRAFEIVCAIRLQALFRGYRCRKVYRSKLRTYYRSNKGSDEGDSSGNQRRKLFYQQELSSYTNEMEKQINQRSTEVNSMMRYHLFLSELTTVTVW
jgi:hypothetical protein